MNLNFFAIRIEFKGGKQMFRKDRAGTFSTNCSGGMSITKIPERWKPTLENNLKLAKMLDEADIDFMLPVARW